ncbi:DUF488 domain-containing protein [Elizabethkingia ursingii]|uniref:MarR family transcriptional regulator n=1 Tax=Elizabethkingia ursingii TaxID=1756150 RepID=A0AAJ3NF65_9FLAO|nr:DUF488 domain-containing protein [Elizabethkingia ursingii]AQX07742.1 hypothetical protein BBD34_03380 [Elizabethkingia ursingii]OPB79410.1 hypothetical protein BAY32_17055 [Elizabethkingia ursingii]
MQTIYLKRVYEKPSPEDGYRVLVDRLWPRGISKPQADIAEWDKDLAPSTELRKWFHHDPALWAEFSAKYKAELLDKNPGLTFLKRLEKEEVITLVYAAKDEKHCHPLVLKKYLDDIIAKKANQNKPQP